MRGHAWLCVTARGSARRCATVYSDARRYSAMRGGAWLCNGMRGHAVLWLHMAAQGYAWLRMAMRGHTRLHMALHCYAWLCAAMHGYTRLRMAAHGCECVRMRATRVRACACARVLARVRACAPACMCACVRARARARVRAHVRACVRAWMCSRARVPACARALVRARVPVRVHGCMRGRVRARVPVCVPARARACVCACARVRACKRLCARGLGVRACVGECLRAMRCVRASSNTARNSSLASASPLMPWTQRPDAVLWPTPEAVAAKPMSKPVARAKSAGAHVLPPVCIRRCRRNEGHANECTHTRAPDVANRANCAPGPPPNRARVHTRGGGSFLDAESTRALLGTHSSCNRRQSARNPGYDGARITRARQLGMRRATRRTMPGRIVVTLRGSEYAAVGRPHIRGQREVMRSIGLHPCAWLAPARAEAKLVRTRFRARQAPLIMPCGSRLRTGASRAPRQTWQRETRSHHGALRGRGPCVCSPGGGVGPGAGVRAPIGRAAPVVRCARKAQFRARASARDSARTSARHAGAQHLFDTAIPCQLKRADHLRPLKGTPGSRQATAALPAGAAVKLRGQSCAGGRRCNVQSNQRLLTCSGTA